MIYFQNITNLEQAKLQYRKLVKQLHPDKGGSQSEFQHMQQEFQTLLLELKQQDSITDSNNRKKESTLLTELDNLAQTLLKSKLPQQFLKQKIKNSNSSYAKLFYFEMTKALDKFS